MELKSLEVSVLLVMFVFVEVWRQDRTPEPGSSATPEWSPFIVRKMAGCVWIQSLQSLLAVLILRMISVRMIRASICHR